MTIHATSTLMDHYSLRWISQGVWQPGCRHWARGAVACNEAHLAVSLHVCYRSSYVLHVGMDFKASAATPRKVNRCDSHCSYHETLFCSVSGPPIKGEALANHRVSGVELSA